jgi:hypothetical protein
VGEHHALGQTCGARRVRQDGHVVLWVDHNLAKVGRATR